MLGRRVEHLLVDGRDAGHVRLRRLPTALHEGIIAHVVDLGRRLVVGLGMNEEKLHFRALHRNIHHARSDAPRVSPLQLPRVQLRLLVRPAVVLVVKPPLLHSFFDHVRYESERRVGWDPFRNVLDEPSGDDAANLGLLRRSRRHQMPQLGHLDRPATCSLHHDAQLQDERPDALQCIRMQPTVAAELLRFAATLRPLPVPSWISRLPGLLCVKEGASGP
eukprot:scaffold1087_cov198-Pinguiococcus_pyrenoidosus.AAC.32